MYYNKHILTNGRNKMKSECGRFEFRGEEGIHDNLCDRYVSLNGEIKQIKGLQEVQYGEQSKKLISDFIKKITPFIESLTHESKQKVLKSNFLHEFNKNLNEGY